MNLLAVRLFKVPVLGVSLLLLLACAYGCAPTKVVTVPMRVSGAVISVVPVVGNTVDKAIDKTADLIE